jgi:formate hydrogenlyase subunit 4
VRILIETLLLVVTQVALLLMAAPLVNGVIKKAKALLQNRRGPSIWQPYRDIWKFMTKERVVSEHHSWIFRAAPYVVFITILLAALLAPTFIARSPLGFAGDLILLVGFMALGRFFLALAGLDTGSAFGGMGSSREMAIAVLVEPGLLLGLFAVALPTGSTELGRVVTWITTEPDRVFAISQVLALGALLIVAIAETGRIPVDNPDTHLELTMIHEGMVLEYSGKDLGVLVWSEQIKQVLIFGLLANLFLPWGIALEATPTAILIGIGAYIIKVLGLGLLFAIIETSFAKMRIFAVPELLSVASGLSVLALAAHYIH